MKHFTYGLMIVAIFTLLQSSAFAQITITASDLTNLFGAGTSEQSYSNFDSSETMNVGSPSSSSSQSWTYPAFVVTDSSRVDNVSPASTPYAAEFPGATYAEAFSQTDSGLTIQYYSYLLLSNDSLYFIGIAQHIHGSSGGHAIDTTMFQRGRRFTFHLPLALGSVVVGSSDTTIYGPGIFQVSTSTSKYDAYGTLTLPNGSFQALRSYDATTFKVYNNGTLINSSTSYSLEWSTSEGHQLTVGIDSGATSGTVKVNSVSWTRVEQTPTFVNMSTEQPAGFMLSQNYPNPFNPSTVISYQIPTSGQVTLKVYGILGREVATLVNERENAGSYSVTFDGSRLASGVYFYRLQAGNVTKVMKMIILK